MFDGTLPKTCYLFARALSLMAWLPLLILNARLAASLLFADAPLVSLSFNGWVLIGLFNSTLAGSVVPFKQTRGLSTRVRILWLVLSIFLLPLGGFYSGLTMLLPTEMLIWESALGTIQLSLPPILWIIWYRQHKRNEYRTALEHGEDSHVFISTK